MRTKTKQRHFVIICDSKYNSLTTLYLVDRSIVKNRWWSRFMSDALILRDRQDAESIANKYLYNNVRVKEI